MGNVMPGRLGAPVVGGATGVAADRSDSWRARMCSSLLDLPPAAGIS